MMPKPIDRQRSGIWIKPGMTKVEWGCGNCHPKPTIGAPRRGAAFTLCSGNGAQ